MKGTTGIWIAAAVVVVGGVVWYATASGMVPIK